MAYGEIKVDTITFTDGGIDKSVSISGLVQNPTFSGNITVTGTISGATVQGTAGDFTTITGGVTTITSGVFALGTNALPSISFNSDPDTGLYSPGADQLALATSGEGRLFISADGKVGLNESNPSSYSISADNLVIKGTANEGISIISGNINSGNIWFGDADAQGKGQISYSHNTDSLSFSTNGYGRLHISSTGDVDIVGAGSPFLTQAISFSGSAPVDSMVVNSSGYVGINTSTPLVNLHVKNTALLVGALFESSSANSYIKFLDTAGQAQIGNNGNDFVVRTFVGFGDYERLRITSAGTLMHLGAGNSITPAVQFNGSAPVNSLVMDSSGRVGLGTSVPESRIHSTKPSSSYQPIATFSSQDGTVKLRFDDTSNSASINRVYITHNYSRPGGTFTADDASVGVSAIKFDDGTIAFATDAAGDSNPANALFIDSSQRVGIGITSPNVPLHIYHPTTNGVATFESGDADALINFKDNATTNSPSVGATGNDFKIITSSTERARIDSSGRLLVGTSTSDATLGSLLQVVGSGVNSSPLFYRPENNTVGPRIYLAKSRGSTLSSKTIVQSDDDLGAIQFRGADGSIDAIAAQIAAFVDGTPGANDMPGRLVFSTTADGASSPTSRFRIDSSGRIDHFASDNVGHELHTSSTGASDEVYRIRNGATDLDNGTTVMKILADGDLENTNNSYGAISDIKLKENVVDATSQWGDLKSLQVRKYNFKEETGYGTHTQIGLIAQEVELVSPGLVSESPDLDEDGNDLGTVTKSVNYSVLYMKAVKALQEAMERIEVLEQRLTDAGIA